MLHLPQRLEHSSVNRRRVESVPHVGRMLNALKLMKDGKSPGNDGLTKEFDMCFFDKLESSLRKSLIFGSKTWSFQHLKSR